MSKKILLKPRKKNTQLEETHYLTQLIEVFMFVFIQYLIGMYGPYPPSCSFFFFLLLLLLLLLFLLHNLITFI